VAFDYGHLARPSRHRCRGARGLSRCGRSGRVILREGYLGNQ
jgi:hypothetical protein